MLRIGINDSAISRCNSIAGTVTSKCSTAKIYSVAITPKVKKIKKMKK